ncbi:MAG: ABC transporter ATP-binding protein [Candidatus Heimdallarchaeota archaeon]|nr:ABC transporter ATP-binding protein [Candidatus Heimdallarchaeota archaeon]
MPKKSPENILKDSNQKRKILLRCENLEKYYSKKSIGVHALRGVNVTIFEKEFVAIIGSSGSGKTTLLNLIGGLDKPSSGKIFIEEKEVSSLNDEERTILRRKIGFIFQDFNLHPVLTAAQNIELPLIYAEKLSKNSRISRVNELLDKVGLLDKKNHIPAELSSGEKQRVGIARALANKPILLLADQPTGNLDSEIGSEIINLLQKLKNSIGLTIILVTHNMDVAKKADRILTIQDGKIKLATL